MHLDINYSVAADNKINLHLIPSEDDDVFAAWINAKYNKLLEMSVDSQIFYRQIRCTIFCNP